MGHPNKDCHEIIKEENSRDNKNEGNSTKKYGYCKINNHEEKDCQKKKSPKRKLQTFTGEVIHDKPFICKRVK